MPLRTAVEDGRAWCDGLVVVSASAYSVSHPTHEQKDQANDKEDDPNHEDDMSKGESRGDGGQQEPKNGEDDAEYDHGDYLISVKMSGCVHTKSKGRMLSRLR
jgi:hypothetical protein